MNIPSFWNPFFWRPQRRATTTERRKEIFFIYQPLLYDNIIERFIFWGYFVSIVDISQHTHRETNTSSITITKWCQLRNECKPRVFVSLCLFVCACMCLLTNLCCLFGKILLLSLTHINTYSSLPNKQLAIQFGITANPMMDKPNITFSSLINI